MTGAKGEALDSRPNKAEAPNARIPRTGTNGVEGDLPRLALRPREAAKALGIGERKLWEVTADHTSGIPHVRLGKVVVYPVDELRRWLAERAQRKGGSR
jgi:predicted DNA-binding transcriptional regulator AlpA